MKTKVFIPLPFFGIIKKINEKEEFLKGKIRPYRFPYWEIDEEYFDEVMNILNELGLKFTK